MYGVAQVSEMTELVLAGIVRATIVSFLATFLATFIDRDRRDVPLRTWLMLLAVVVTSAS